MERGAGGSREPQSGGGGTTHGIAEVWALNTPWRLSISGTHTTGEVGPDPGPPPLDRHHPRPDLPRRIVSHVLLVTALELGHPVIRIILMEAGDAAVHRYLVQAEWATW